MERLSQAGIHGHGSEELRLYESRLCRYFAREYGRLEDHPERRLRDYGISTREGPMWQETEALMSQHYDERPEFFQAFLDTRYLAYSMAYYGATPAAVVHSDRSLEAAQQAKFELICQRARLRGDERIFSIGCGFAPLETFLLENYPGVQVVSITPSQVQADYIRTRMQDAVHPLSCGRIRLIQGDFATATASDLGRERYDLVFAVGMFEHVNNLHSAFHRIATLLRANGRCFLHLIVSQPLFPQYLDARRTLIGRYFPGGRVWPFREIREQTEFFDLVDCWFVNGLNYWRTLDEWHRRFWAHMDQLYGPVLSLEGVRHWNDYFSLCKTVLFAPLEGRVYGNGHYLFRKKTNGSDSAIRGPQGQDCIETPEGE
jgi:cyclopropane-fatty-acyl-phospholipid synthase